MVIASEGLMTLDCWWFPNFAGALFPNFFQRECIEEVKIVEILQVLGYISL
jgi:hypothetical protein